jgi:hypothetical protein
VDAAVVLAHALLLAHPDLVGHLVDEAEVVRDQDDPALEGLDCGGEAVDGIDVQVVGRLVEQEHLARVRVRVRVRVRLRIRLRLRVRLRLRLRLRLWLSSGTLPVPLTLPLTPAPRWSASRASRR